MPLTDSLRKFIAATSTERLMFLRCLFLLPATNAGLRLFGLKRWHAVLKRMVRVKIARELDITNLARARSTARMVQAAARYGVFTGQCLPQSLLLWWLLRRQGFDSQLKIGMQKENGTVKGHAWVEVEREILNDTDDVGERFESLIRWGSGEQSYS